ncbi:tetratricopeptide repeat protein 19, mitochondrial-like [Physella acuta]|uniref:tetratricopeptide repeat protein 19, mitochondrial-like n=1 Tax=Physella acuta TaxID=109671 RepID=UPI0027DB89F0|nr:tetratricopeptide repeat protein 19, mitochondrial-like [Physella acuta]
MATSIAMVMGRRLCSNIKLIRFKFEQKSDRINRIIRFREKNSTHSLTLTVAGTTYGISLGLLGLNFGKKQETDALTQKYRDARLAHMKRDLKLADDLYHECLKLASELAEAKEITEDKFVTARTLMYDGLADIAMQTGDIETAEVLYKDTMKGCLQQGMDVTHNTIVEISLKLASIYAIIGKKEEAEEGFVFCIQTQTPKLADKVEKLTEKAPEGAKTPTMELTETEKDTASLLGMALSSYGRFLLYEKRYTEALPMFEKSLMYAENVLGTNSNQYLVVLNDIATLYIVTKNLTEAEKLLKKGIEISKSSNLGEGATLFCNLGAIYLRKGEVMSATSTCKKGLDYAKKFDHKMAINMAEACLQKAATLNPPKK